MMGQFHWTCLSNIFLTCSQWVERHMAVLVVENQSVGISSCLAF